MKVKAYVDGSYLERDEVKAYGSGAAVFVAKKDIHLVKKNSLKQVLEKSGYIGISVGGSELEYIGSRNITGELLAAVLAIQTAIALGATELEIVHDLEGTAKWVDGTWKNANKPITRMYKQIFSALSKEVRIRFTWVKGHDGNEGNEIADTLAGMAAEKEIKRVKGLAN